MVSWSNFIFIIVGQLFVFCLGVRLRGLSVIKALRLSLFSMLLGLPMGLLFDIFIGRYQSIFSYERMPNTHFFWILNGILSYGLAIATAWLFPVNLARHQSINFKMIGILLISLSGSTIIFLTSISLPILQSMFAWGISLILCSEGLAALTDRTGPFMALAMHQFRPLMMLWSASILVGAIYEGLNGVFPLWSWHLSDEISFWNNEYLMISVGYVVLFQPMLILSRLVIKDT